MKPTARIINTGAKSASIQLFGDIGEARGRRADAAALERFSAAFTAYSNGGSISVYEEIGEYGTTLKQFDAALSALAKVEEIDLFLNSQGGSVMEGIGIYSVLNRHPANIRVHIVGWAASIASVIACAGDSIEIEEAGTIMVHRALAAIYGYADDMRELADVLDALSAQIAGIYAKRTGNSLSSIQKMMDKETWMNAEEAIRLGFADTIYKGGADTSAAGVRARLAQLDAHAAAAQSYKFSPAAVAARLREVEADVVLTR